MENLLPILKRYAKPLGFALLAAAIGVMFCTVLWRAWVAEDMYITFRVVDNFIAGHGLRWNIHERVQAYTHPLWMLLHIPVAAATGNIFLSNIILSVLCCWAALIVALMTMRKPPLLTVLYFLLPLYLSKSFMDYTTSGLENPLSYLLFAAFGYVLLNCQQHRYFWFYISLFVALSLFNRLDTVIVYLPVLAYLTLSRFTQMRWVQIILGALPLIGWLSFSLFYYGFLFPNTKYAKLGTGFDWSVYLAQGIEYYKHIWVFDLPGALLLTSSLVLLFNPRWLRSSSTLSFPRLPQCLGLSVLSYTLYVIYIGGDYMGGRFWAFPIFVSVWSLYAFLPLRVRADIQFAIAAVLIAAHISIGYLGWLRWSCPTCIPIEGRLLDAINTFRANSLVRSEWPFVIRLEGHYPFAQEGRRIAEMYDVPAKQMFFVGMTAYYAGAKAPIVDMLGLTDPLIARLPAVPEQKFYPAHFRRIIPRGYYKAIDTGSLEDMHPALAIYYDKLRLITSGNLLDSQRLKTIILFNLGYYDDWKNAYLYATRR